MEKNNSSESTKIIRWGIIGCGNVTEIKSGPAYQKTEGFKLMAVMRRDAENAIHYLKIVFRQQWFMLLKLT